MKTYKKDNQPKKPEHKFSNYEEFQKDGEAFSKRQILKIGKMITQII